MSNDLTDTMLMSTIWYVDIQKDHYIFNVADCMDDLQCQRFVYVVDLQTDCRRSWRRLSECNLFTRGGRRS